ncbi:MAG TPA: S9 family peptidase [Candidatus Krumholzibacteria bacterium]|nr:S9 family peptidase [Candidatus Krumholzibacteria bacterium]
MRTLSIVVPLVLCLASLARAADTHAFNVKDMWEMQRISDPQVSPDGKWVLFTLRTTDFEANKGRTDVWMIGSDGNGLRQVTDNPAGDSGARWSPDGKWIYFTSTRSGSSQVWKVPVAGGEAVQVTNLPLDVANLIVSDDGSHLAFSVPVFTGTSIDETAKQLEARKAEKATGMIYDQLMFRHWDTWWDGRRSHIFVMPAAGGDAVDIMKNMDADCPSVPFGGNEEFTFTPDGKSMVFSSKNVGREEAWSTNFDLFLAPIDGSAAPSSITAENKAWDTRPVFSPDGKQMAYLAMKRPGFEADRLGIMVRAWPDGATREVAPAWDRSAESFVWSKDGKTLYVVATNLGNQSLFAIDVAKGTAKTIVKEGWVGSIAGFAGKRIIYGSDNLRSPVELYSASLDGKDVKPVTKINADRLAAIRFGEPEQFSFKGANNDDVYAWVVKPADYDPARKYPVAFLVHGGPQGSMSNHFHYRWNPEFYAGAGYAVIVIDFHGSTGYGQAFCDAISNDWGGKPLEDLQKGLDAALAKYPYMDRDHMVALGASYGGWMINWMLGHWSDPFKAFVCHDGNLDERFAYFDTEELWFPEWEHGGTPWANPEGYAKANPIESVGKWKTPTLVIHGGRDFRIPYSEGIATFTALQRQGIPSKFIFYPDESHWVLKPANSIQWHNEVLAWIDRWAKGDGGASGATHKSE